MSDPMFVQQVLKREGIVPHLAAALGLMVLSTVGTAAAVAAAVAVVVAVAAAVAATAVFAAVYGRLLL